MTRRSLTAEQEGQVRAFLSLKWSYSVIIKHFKGEGITITKNIISRIRHRKENDEKSSRAAAPGQKRKAGKRDLKVLSAMLDNVNPPTQAAMARKLKVSPRSIRRYIGILKRRKVKKGKVHALSPSMIEKRAARSNRLYNRLRGDQYKKYITSDEAWVYLTGTGGTRDIQYLTSDQTWHEKENQPVQSHPKGIMVWVAFDDNRIFSPQFVKPGCKVKADYYIKKVLAPFFHEYNQYYPNKNMIFHHDSAPAHTARKTLKFFEEQKIPFMPPGDLPPVQEKML